MNRRLALTALTTALALPTLATTALAQAESSASKGMGEGAEPLSEAEMKHVTDTMKVGALSLATSRIALKKAENAKVKEFAGFEVAEQETVADVLKSLKDQGTPVSGKVKPPSEDEVRALLDAKGRKMVEMLEEAKAGDAFDREYVKGQIDGHHMLLKIQETYLETGKDREHVGMTKLARGLIKEHLQILADLEKGIGRG